MTKFIDAVESEEKNQKTRTTNGMKARVSTANDCVDLFFKIGASRGQDIIPQFIKAFNEDKDIALKIAQWARDVRGGAGERQLFRDILLHLEIHHPVDLISLIPNIAEIGRADDLLIFKTNRIKSIAFEMFSKKIIDQNRLFCKWTPREGSSKSQIAYELRKYMGLTPKAFRKLLVEGTKVVESDLCSNKWNDINFSHVPSKAMSIYKKAFDRHTTKFQEYLVALQSGDPSVKINAGAIFPHEVIGHVNRFRYVDSTTNQSELITISEQWKALPDYLDGSNLLAMVDTSGSMYAAQIPGSSYYAGDVAVALGLYISDKSKSAFKDLFLTFSSNPEFVHVKGNIIEKIKQMSTAGWNQSTDLLKAIQLILDTAIKGSVDPSDMPQTLLILSDMQFNSSWNNIGKDLTAFKSIKKMYNDAGYEIPNIVFWNLCAHDNVPVKFDKIGVALVSGFSPSIIKSILSSSDDFTPMGIMMKALSDTRYNLNTLL